MMTMLSLYWNTQLHYTKGELPTHQEKEAPSPSAFFRRVLLRCWRWCHFSGGQKCWTETTEQLVTQGLSSTQHNTESWKRSPEPSRFEEKLGSLGGVWSIWENTGECTVFFGRVWPEHQSDFGLSSLGIYYTETKRNSPGCLAVPFLNTDLFFKSFKTMPSAL